MGLFWPDLKSYLIVLACFASFCLFFGQFRSVLVFLWLVLKHFGSFSSVMDQFRSSSGLFCLVLGGFASF